MPTLPEPPAAPTAGQATTPLTDAVIRAAVDNLVHEARRESTSPPPQREVPAMSARTTETARAVMFCSLATVPPGLLAIGVMLASEHADPTVIGMICAAPAAIAVPNHAHARLIHRAGEAAPTEINQTYTGNVHQETRITHTRAVWSKNINNH